MKKIIFIVVTIGVLLGGFVNAKQSQNPDTININFQDLKIEDFVKMVAKITGKNILISNNIPGKVNFVSIKPIKKGQIYDLLLNVLQTKGYTIRDSRNGYLKVIRSSESTKSSPPIAGSAKISETQTEIIGIKNLNVRTIQKHAQNFLSRYGKISSAYEINSLIVTDFPQNIKTIKSIIYRLDQEKQTGVEFVTLQNAQVKSVFSKVTKIANAMFDKKINTQKMNIFQDEGTNSIIIVGRVTNINKLIPYILELDKPNEVVEKRIAMVFVKNADASEIVKTLEKILSNKSFSQSIKQETPKSTAPKAAKLDPDGKKKTAPVPAAPSFQYSSSSSISKEDKPTVTADVELNAIILYASEREIRELKKVIEQLDVERQQVYVKARILEISNDEATRIGAKYGILGGIVNDSGLYGFSTQLMGGSVAPLASIKSYMSSFSIPSVDKALALGATISLFDNNGVANILSEPSILCINNKESSIYVGRTESIVTQSTAGSSTTDLTKNSYSREDIGLTLKVKPRISADKKVSLEVKTILEDVIGGEAGLPTTTKREVETTAIVKNGESVIIGGLVKDKINQTISKIPLLGDIPLLGIPFRHKEDSKDKVNLVIMLTPYIVEKSSDLSKLREMLGELDKLEKRMADEAEKRVIKEDSKNSNKKMLSIEERIYNGNE